MIQVVFLVLFLSLPLLSEAAYKIILKNGSVLSGVSSYEKSNGQVMIYYGSGSVGVPEKDILKIEETNMPVRDLTVSTQTGAPGSLIESRTDQPAISGEPPIREEADNDKASRESVLRSELDTISSEIRSLEAEEARLAAEVNQKNSGRTTWNYYQMQQLQKETDPIRQELYSIQQKKSELIQRKSALESEIRASQ